MNLVSILDIGDALLPLLKKTQELKDDAQRGVFEDRLKNKSVSMIFNKPSTRTRVSFEVAMVQLGGHAIYLDKSSMQLERGETIKDTALTLSKYVDAILVRSGSHANVVELAKYSRVPVINCLTELEHPCQVLADLYTVRECKGAFNSVKLAYVGDGNNVCHSLLLGSAMAGMSIAVASPKGYEPSTEFLMKAKTIAATTGSDISAVLEPEEAVEGADIIYTDVWVSMGQETEKKKRLRDLRSYQVNAELVKKAGNPLIMHCLPAKRGQEITDEVLESENSIVFKQAENRLHLQKALLCYLIGVGLK